jgi:hypothetical protein
LERAAVTVETERDKWPNLDVYDDDDDDDAINKRKCLLDRKLQQYSTRCSESPFHFYQTRDITVGDQCLHICALRSFRLLSIKEINLTENYRYCTGCTEIPVGIISG